MVQLNPCTKEHVLKDDVVQKLYESIHGQKSSAGTPARSGTMRCWKLIEELGRTDSD